MSSTSAGDSIRPVSFATPHCEEHGEVATLVCERCQVACCPKCVKTTSGKQYCARCHKRGRYLRGFFLARLSVLLTVLLLVVLYALGDVKNRHARTEWKQTLSVAVVLVTDGHVKPEAVARFRERLPVLEQRLASEFSRYRVGPWPFRFVLYGPVHGGEPPPLPTEDGYIELFQQRYHQWRYLSAIDQSGSVDSSRYDSRIYVVARPAQRSDVQFVEGHGEQGGRVGVVEVELEEQMVDMVLSVIAHELFHTLGAEDKYGANGHTLVPEGLAEPNRTPLFPQHYVEVMARNRPVSRDREYPLTTLDEFRVGPLTAREIHWAPR